MQRDLVDWFRDDYLPNALGTTDPDKWCFEWAPTEELLVSKTCKGGPAESPSNLEDYLDYSADELHWMSVYNNDQEDGADELDEPVD